MNVSAYGRNRSGWSSGFDTCQDYFFRVSQQDIDRLKDVAEKFRGSCQAEPVYGVDGHHDIIVARKIAPPVWFRQITHPRPPGYTIAAIDRAAQRDKELIPIHGIDPRVRKSRMNDAA